MRHQIELMPNAGAGGMFVQLLENRAGVMSSHTLKTKSQPSVFSFEGERDRIVPSSDKSKVPEGVENTQPELATTNAVTAGATTVRSVPCALCNNAALTTVRVDAAQERGDRRRLPILSLCV